MFNHSGITMHVIRSFKVREGLIICNKYLKFLTLKHLVHYQFQSSIPHFIQTLKE